MTSLQQPPAEYVQAAQATINAAAAALVWSTADPHGVLAHVAGADPALMATTRLTYERTAATIAAVAATRCRGYAELQQLYRTTDAPFEVAALPWTVAPDWSSRIRRALIRSPPQGAYDPRASAARSVVDDALHACRQWGEEQLDTDRVTYWAGQASGSADWCWRFHTV
jgi:hypothetical protein